MKNENHIVDDIFQKTGEKVKLNKIYFFSFDLKKNIGMIRA